MKKFLGASATALLVTTTVTLFQPVAAAQTITTTTTALTRTCVPFESGGGASNTNPNESMNVTHPTSVRPNETFTLHVVPGEITTGQRVGRMSYDFTLPSGVQVLGTRVLGSGVNMDNPQAVAKLTRVDDERHADPNGNVLRYWGGAATGPGDNSVDHWSGFFDINTSFDEGLNTDSQGNFRVPEFEVTLRANADFTGDLVFGMSGAGQGGSVTDASRNNFTFMESNLVNSKSWSYYCGASANAANIATVTVAGDVWQTPSTIALVNPPAEVQSGQPFALQAKVEAPAAAAGDVQAGRVEFVDETGTVVATAPVSADGTASADASLPALAEGDTRADHTIFARFVGAALVEPSQSPTAAIAVVPKVYRDNPLTVSVDVQQGQLTEGGVPVTISAVVSGGTIPAGLQVEVLKNGERLGEPLTVPADGRVTVSDVATQGSNDAFYRYQVRVVEKIVGDDRYRGESTTSPVLVQGSDPVSDLTPGYEPLNGTGSLTNILADPDTLWNKTTGSVRGLGALSLQMTANP